MNPLPICISHYSLRFFRLNELNVCSKEICQGSLIDFSIRVTAMYANIYYRISSNKTEMSKKGFENMGLLFLEFCPLDQVIY